MSRASAGFAAFLALLAIALVSLDAVRPVIVMFYGGDLARPVCVTDTMAVHNANNPTSLRIADMGDRPYLNVAMFWGPKFNVYRSGERPLTELTLAQAGQHGRFYPRTGTTRAVLLQTVPRGDPQLIPSDVRLFVWGAVLADQDVDTLARAGVPVTSR